MEWDQYQSQVEIPFALYPTTFHECLYEEVIRRRRRKKHSFFSQLQLLLIQPEETKEKKKMGINNTT